MKNKTDNIDESSKIGGNITNKTDKINEKFDKYLDELDPEEKKNLINTSFQDIMTINQDNKENTNLQRILKKMEELNLDKIESDWLSTLEKNYDQFLHLHGIELHYSGLPAIGSKPRYYIKYEKYFQTYEKQAKDLNEKGRPLLSETLNHILERIDNLIYEELEMEINQIVALPAMLNNFSDPRSVNEMTKYCNKIEEKFSVFKQPAISLNEKGKPYMLERLNFALGQIRDAKNIAYNRLQQTGIQNPNLAMQQQSFAMQQQESIAMQQGNAERFRIIQQANDESFRIMQEAIQRRQTSIENNANEFSKMIRSIPV